MRGDIRYGDRWGWLVAKNASSFLRFKHKPPT
jgi:hypothetical protein